MLSILAVAAASALSVPPADPDHAKPACRNVAPETVKQQKTVRAQKLNELPNANMTLGVLRTLDGCSKPVIVRYDIGSAPRRR